MKFLCDHMLGSLAKWLRLLGHDTAYPGPMGDIELGALAQDEGRVLLTRDRELARRVSGAYRVKSDDLEQQLLDVTRRFRLDLEASTTRCSACNVELVSIGKDQVKGRVPDGVYGRQEEFWRCASCGRLYWHGSHWDNVRARLRRLAAAGARVEPSSVDFRSPPG